MRKTAEMRPATRYTLTARTVNKDLIFILLKVRAFFAECNTTGFPQIPINGEAVVFTQAIFPNEIFNYTCDTNFNLNGADTNRCDANGTFVNQAPTCELGKRFENQRTPGRLVLRLWVGADFTWTPCFFAGLILTSATDFFVIYRGPYHDGRPKAIVSP